MTQFKLRIRLFVALFFCALAGVAVGAEIPAFTPNVVDSAGVLTPAEVREINGAFEAIRTEADIWPAVYLVDTLGNESIESLAERAFRTWQLGQAGRDNGLLLVLAMGDRQSRFEVGYGLEGDLPDVIARRALDDVLAPYMRQGETKAAIVEAFSYMAGVKSGEISFPAQSDEPSAMSQIMDSFSRDGGRRGLLGWLAFCVCLWVFAPLAALVSFACARRLNAVYPEYDITKDKAVNGGKLSLPHLLFGTKGYSGFWVKGFLTINPGVFIFGGGAASKTVLHIIVVICAFAVASYARHIVGR
ncbi:MAG: TPM domain-containing protein, partial [Nevskiaceae bacterium]|nr:TPM domain-containing protein [Nevskiaceae bacterium]